MMDDARRKVLYAQLRLILAELLRGTVKPKQPKTRDDNVLKIHTSEVVGTRERMVH